MSKSLLYQRVSRPVSRQDESPGIYLPRDDSNGCWSWRLVAGGCWEAGNDCTHAGTEQWGAISSEHSIRVGLGWITIPSLHLNYLQVQNEPRS